MKIKNDKTKGLNKIPFSFLPIPGLKILFSLIIGAIGGILFLKMKLPLPWLLGSMVACTLACIGGASLRAPNKLRIIVMPVLGVMLGSSFSPKIFSEAHLWFGSLISLCFFSVIIMMIGAIGIKWAKPSSPATCILSAAPGGFSEMDLLADKYDADRRMISLIHTTRILATVLIIPLWFQIVSGYTVPSQVVQKTITTGSITDFLILIACAITGYFFGKIFRIPASALLGPALLSAIVHMASLTAVKPPSEVLAAAQLVIGTSVGCRFSGITANELFSSILIGLSLALFMISASWVASFGLSSITDIDHQALWLAFAPGGLTEMTLVSLAMDIDVALVSSHHMIRIIFVVTITPIIFRIFHRFLNP